MSTTFSSLKVADVRKETVDCVSVAFHIPAELKTAFAFTPGQYLTLRTMINGEDIRRSYSICSSPGENELRVAVKAVANGKFSKFATGVLKPGDAIDVMPPDGRFLITPEQSRATNYVFFAAGSGITPVMSMIKSILAVEKSSKIFLYYGNKSAGNTIFKSSLDGLADQNPNFKVRYIYSQENSVALESQGRIDEQKCGRFFKEDQESLKLEGVWCCGPKDMIETVKDFYISKGLLHKVHFELFTVPAGEAPKSSVGSPAVESKVTVIIDEIKYDFSLKSSGVSILQAAQNEGADVPFSCKGGVCCTCRAKLLEGTVSMDMNFSLEEDEIQRGFILSCQSHPTSERVVVTYDNW